MKIIKHYKDKNEYINHQLEKTSSMYIIKKHKRNWNKAIKIFKAEFRKLNIPDKSKCLCVCSRYGEEVEALNNLGYNNVIGIDLYECPPYTKKMDMHELEFNDNEFDFIYCNSVDHSYNLTKSISEMYRVCKNKGIISIQIELNNYGDYEVIVFNSVENIKSIFDKLKINYKLKIFTTPMRQRRYKTMKFKINK